MYKIKIKQGDITEANCECIVNAANKSLLGGGGVDGAIHRAAGPRLLEECRTLGGCDTGEAKITKGYDLKADWIIHTVGPVYGGKKEDGELLASCYRSSLDLAREYGIRSIAFPAISTGAYRFPARHSVYIALNSVFEWIDDNRDYDIEIEFYCFDERMYDYYTASYNVIVHHRETGNDASPAKKRRLEAELSKLQAEIESTFDKIEVGDEDENAFDPTEYMRVPVLRRCITEGRASIPFIRRAFTLGYEKARRIMDWLEKNRYVSEADETGVLCERRVLMTAEQFEETFGPLDEY